MEDLDEPGMQFKEICAFYGAAMHMAQVLEHGIVNAIFFLDFLPTRKGEWTDEEYEDFFAGNFSKTFGRLVKSLKKVTVVPSELEALIKESNDRRNYLAHTFFREKTDVLYGGGYQEIIDSLNEDIDQFAKTDQILSAFLKPIWNKFGWTEEAIEAAAEKYKEELGAKYRSKK